MRITFNAVLMIVIGFSAHAGQLAVLPPNAFVAVPPALPTPSVPTPAAPAPVPPVAGVQGVVPSVDADEQLGEVPAEDVDGGGRTGSIAPTQQILSFDVQQLSSVQARQAIPLLESIIAAPPVRLSATDRELLRRQLGVLRSIANQ